MNLYNLSFLRMFDILKRVKTFKQIFLSAIQVPNKIISCFDQIYTFLMVVNSNKLNLPFNLKSLSTSRNNIIYNPKAC